MAESPGKLLSSICLGGDSDNPPKYGGCVNVFLHLFDWNRRLCKRGLLNKKLLPAERRPQRQQSGRKKKQQQQQQQQKMNEDRLPMAKLLLIADENRQQFAMKNSAAAGGIAEQQPAAPKSTPGAIARLMGLEHMPQQAESPAAASATTPEMRSLQELLHLDQEPKMLQEFLRGKQEQQQQQQNKEQQLPSQRDALLSLLIQEVMHAKNKPQNQQQKQRPRRAQRSRSKGNFLSRQIFGTSSSGECAPAKSSSTCLAVATAAGCAGFSKKKPTTLFLEAAAATMLDSHSAQAVAEVTTTSACAKMLEEELEQEEEEEEEEDLFRTKSSPKRRVMSAPCSPVSTRNLSSCTSIRSLMELFLDDLEAELQHESSMFRRHAISEPCSPIRQSGLQAVVGASSASSIAIQESHERVAAAAAEVAAERPVPVEDLGAHDYISFRDFLTGAKSSVKVASSSSSSGSSPASNESSPKAKLEGDVPNEMSTSSAAGHDITRFMSRVVQNPLFEDMSSSDNASSAAGSLFSSEFEAEDDHGLEEILKSILCQTTSDANQERGLIDTSRLTWFPDASSTLASHHNNYLYNKDSSEADESPRSKGMLDDSLEVTSSESNCGEDGGQPSPVSVLDSPFDDELSRKGKAASSIHRKRLDFDEQVVSSTLSSNGGGSNSILARLQCFDPDTLDEAAEYMSMVLEQSGLFHQAEVLLLLPPETSPSSTHGGGGMIISNSVFERLEDRMRVQQLIQHLEHCGSSSERSSKNLESLRAHYQRYHESRSRRRMVFDFMNETLSSIMAKFGDVAWARSARVKLVVPSGQELVNEVHTKVSQWRRKQFESTHELVEDDMNSRSCNKEWSEFRAEMSEIGLCCERDIFEAMIGELANDLLACRQQD